MSFVWKSNISYKCSGIFDRDVLDWSMQKMGDISSWIKKLWLFPWDMIFIAEYMNFNRNRRKSKSDLKNQNFDDQYWKTYYIYTPKIFWGVFYMSWLSETILSFKIASKLLKLFTLVRVKCFCGHPVLVCGSWESIML